MKKIFGLILSIILALSLVACAGVQTVNAPSENPTQSIEPTNTTNDSEYPNMYIFIDDGEGGCYNLWSNGEVIHDEEYDHYEITIDDPTLLAFKISESRYPGGVGTMSGEEVNSSVSEALIDNIIIENPKKYINKAMASIGGFALIAEDDRKPLMAFYPDEGAMKRYSGLIPMAYAFGIKKRDWESGKILGLDAAGSTDLIPMSDVLIIDDISSRGGTFYHSAKKLKELGANKIYLYVSHCEATILDGEIFKSGLIDKVFTTNSIFNAEAMKRAEELGVAEMIEVFEYEKD